jgi:phosphohistidine swiveling domain-containing protein
MDGGQDATVGRPLTIEALEVPTVVGQHGAAEGVCAGQYVRVRGRRPPVLLGRYHVVPPLAKNHDDREGKVLVGVE